MGCPWPADDPDANFKADVALYTKLDPLRQMVSWLRAPLEAE